MIQDRPETAMTLTETLHSWRVFAQSLPLFVLPSLADTTVNPGDDDDDDDDHGNSKGGGNIEPDDDEGVDDGDEDDDDEEETLWAASQLRPRRTVAGQCPRVA